MIAVKLLEGQGLGNQLWLILSACGIAKDLNTQIKILDYRNFKARSFIDFSHLSGDEEDGDLLTINEESFFDSYHNFLLSCYDSSLYQRIRQQQVKDVNLVGLLQSEKYFDSLDLETFFPYSDEFIEYKPDSVSNETCILNIRGGEYKKYKGFILPKSYWQSAMGHMKDLFGIKDFLVVTDDPYYSKSLFPSLPIISDSIFDCYSALYNARYIISSNSTFSYFPIKTSLSNKRFIIAPKYWANYNSESSLWLSPCNIYRGWHWLDSFGNLFTTKECLDYAIRTEEYYRLNYCVRIPQYQSLYKRRYPLVSLLPKPFKKWLIRMVRPLFPGLI